MCGDESEGGRSRAGNDADSVGPGPGAGRRVALGRPGTLPAATPSGRERVLLLAISSSDRQASQRQIAELEGLVRSAGADIILGNTYHLMLRPGAERVARLGGLHKFMRWDGPILTDSGGFQVMSLGAGFKKVLAMETDTVQSDDVIAENKTRLAHVDDDGVTFKSHLDGTMHRFTPEFSMQVQHQLGADIMFAFDELTTLMNTRDYQVMSLERTRLWALRCIAEHQELTKQRSHRPYQA